MNMIVALPFHLWYNHTRPVAQKEICEYLPQQSIFLLHKERMNQMELFFFIEKPKPSDTFSIKEKYIQSKYVDKLLLARDANQITMDILEAIKTNDLRAAYHILVIANVNPNMTYDEFSKDLHHDQSVTDRMLLDPVSCDISEDAGKPEGCLQGCSLLHLACQYGHAVMVELLLLFGADINMQDFHGRTPLHRCVQNRNDDLTKHLLKRGARTTIKDGGGLTALERRMELGAITDEELFILFVRCENMVFQPCIAHNPYYNKLIPCK